MQEKDKLDWFIVRLQSWAQAEVERSNPETLEEAYVVAERLADTQRKSHAETFKPRANSDHDGKKEERRDSRHGSSSPKSVDRRPFFRRDYRGPPREVVCWVCKGRHATRDCPRQERPAGRVNALRATVSEADAEEAPLRMGAMQLNCMKREEPVKVTATPSNQPLHVELLVNGKATIAMIDTGATHNFVSIEEARRLGLTLEKGELRMKAMNSEAKPIHGVARDVAVKIESWSGKANFSVVQMDDFQAILGMELLTTAKMVPMPHLRSVSIMDEKSPCMVPAVAMRKDKGKAAMVSAVQLEKSLKPPTPAPIPSPSSAATPPRRKWSELFSRSSCRKEQNGGSQGQDGRASGSVSAQPLRHSDVVRAPAEQRDSPIKRMTERQIDKVLRHKEDCLGVPKMYKVRWIGKKNTTWEPAVQMKQFCPLEVKAYHKAEARRGRRMF